LALFTATEGIARFKLEKVLKRITIKISVKKE